MQNHGVQSNNALSLANRLKEQMESETQQSKEIMQRVFSNLSNELQQSAKNELHSIQYALLTAAEEYHELQQSTFKQLKTTLKFPILVSIFLTAIVCVTIILSTTVWLDIEQKELLTLRQTNKELRETKATMSSWGISTVTYEESRYIIFPKGTKLEERQTKNGNIALRIVE